MDGTLVDSTPIVEELWREFANNHSLSYGELVQFAHGRPTRDTIAHFLPPGAVGSELRAFEKQELTRTNGIRAVPGAGALLAAIAEFPTALVTSATDKLARFRMSVAGLPIPPIVVAADGVTEGKPSPQPYLRAAALLGIPIQDCLVFEDALAGVVSATRARAQLIVVGTDQLVDGVPHVRDFTQVVVGQDGDRLILSLPASSSPDTPSDPNDLL
ncbi:HAD-IA family hydrolase [Microbacterium lacticum]